MPGPCSDAVGYDGGKETVEVEQEEQGQDAADEDLNEKDPIEASVVDQRLDGQPIRHCVVSSA